MPLAKEQYWEYINSEQWADKTELIRERNGGVCELCQMRLGWYVHHRTYARLGEELESDLILLCYWCHQTVHQLCTDHYIPEGRIKFLKELQEEIFKEIGIPKLKPNQHLFVGA